MYPRHVEPALARRLAEHPVVRLTGPRTCGKTTTCAALIESMGGSVVRLDDPAERRAAAADPGGFLRGLPRPVLVDEYQHVPDVLDVVKGELSRAPGTVGQWLLCGSISVDAMIAAAQSLGGRLTDLTMGTLTLDERRSWAPSVFLRRVMADGSAFLHGWRPPVRLDRAELLGEVATGGFPLVVDQRDREGAVRRLLADWVSAAVIADAAAVGGVRNTEELRRMLGLYAASTASITPKNAPTADRLEIARPTAARYRSVLADLHVTWELSALVPGNATGQITKSGKLHLADSGLAAHLSGRDSLAALDRDPAATGALVETAVVNDLRVQAECADDPLRLFHYREDQYEVDLVVEDGSGRLFGIEVKLTSDPGPDVTRGLARLRRSCGPRFAGGVVLARVPVGRASGDFTVAPLEAVWTVC